MTNQTLPPEAKRYLESLASAAADLPPEVGSDLLADIRSHLTEAVAADRPIDNVLRSLGPPETVAAEVRDSLGLHTDNEDARIHSDEPSAAESHTRKLNRVRTGLSLAATLTGLLTAVLTSFLLPGSGNVGSGPGVQPPGQGAGLLLAAITLVPALVAAVPLLLPIRHRGAATIATALIVTGASFIAMLAPAVASLTLIWLPEAILLWAAVIVPWRLRRRGGRPAHPAWRIVGALVIGAPGVLGLLNLLDGPSFHIGRTFATVGVSLVLAVLYALGVRLAQLAIAVAAVVMLVSEVAQTGQLGPVSWLSSGLWLTLGLGAFASTGWRLRSLR